MPTLALWHSHDQSHPFRSGILEQRSLKDRGFENVRSRLFLSLRVAGSHTVHAGKYGMVRTYSH
jgi:hypothetical protein